MLVSESKQTSQRQLITEKVKYLQAKTQLLYKYETLSPKVVHHNLQWSHESPRTLKNH